MGKINNQLTWIHKQIWPGELVHAACNDGPHQQVHCQPSALARMHCWVLPYSYDLWIISAWCQCLAETILRHEDLRFHFIGVVSHLSLVARLRFSLSDSMFAEFFVRILPFIIVFFAYSATWVSLISSHRVFSNRYLELTLGLSHCLKFTFSS